MHDYRVVLTGIATLFITLAAVAQTNPLAGPGKPITLIVPVSSGTGADIAARQLGPKLSQRLGRPVVVDNRTGASGNIGFAAAARATADGTTLLVSPSSMTILPHLTKAMTWDPFNDFAPVALIATSVMAAIVGPNVQASNMAELVTLARNNPGKLNYATPGVGTAHHLVTEMFRQASGVNIVHIPYKQSAGAVTDLAGGQVDIGFFPLLGVLPLIKSGKLRVLATLGETRTPWTPDVPTMRESGIENVAYNSWAAVFAPKNTPREIVNSLSRDILAILNEPGMRESLLKDGLVVAPLGPDELGTMTRRDSAIWAKVIKTAGIQPE